MLTVYWNRLHNFSNQKITQRFFNRIWWERKMKSPVPKTLPCPGRMIVPMTNPMNPHQIVNAVSTMNLSHDPLGTVSFFGFSSFFGSSPFFGSFLMFCCWSLIFSKKFLASSLKLGRGKRWPSSPTVRIEASTLTIQLSSRVSISTLSVSSQWFRIVPHSTSWNPSRRRNFLISCSS